MIDTLLFDVDETLLDFPACERNALCNALRKNGFPFQEDMYAWYHAFNLSLWKRYEKGEIDRNTVLYSRFDGLFARYGISGNAVLFEEDYVDALANEHVLIDGALEMLRTLLGSYRMYIVTNGVARSQRKRLRESGIDQYMDGVFISEDLGSQKPQREFFDACFRKIGNPDRRTVMIIGDSLTSDIRGGNNAGILTCWYNPYELPKTESVFINYEIKTLNELTELLSAQ